jgi:hypothetical protein
MKKKMGEKETPIQLQEKKQRQKHVFRTAFFTVKCGLNFFTSEVKFWRLFTKACEGKEKEKQSQ